MTKATFELLESALAIWAAGREEVWALALIGSWARGTARPDSDVDVLILTESDPALRACNWLNDIDWASAGVTLKSWSDSQGSGTWSRFVRLEDNDEIEFAFYDASSSTLKKDVLPIANGLMVLYDSKGILASLT